MKKIISIILSVCMLLSVLSAGFVSYAAESLGEGIEYFFDNDGKLIVTGDGWLFDNAADILSVAEGERHNKALSDIKEYYERRAKELEAKIAAFIVEGYYKGTEEEYKAEIAAALENNDISRYNELVILHSNKQSKEICEREYNNLPIAQDNAEKAETEIQRYNLSMIDTTLENGKFIKDKPSEKGEGNGDNKEESPVTPEVRVKPTKIKKIAKGKKKLKVYFAKVSDAHGYQLQFSTSKRFTKKRTKTVNAKAFAKTKTVKRLKRKKRYYVRIRAYKIVDGNKVYSDWSKVKKTKTK